MFPVKDNLMTYKDYYIYYILDVLPRDIWQFEFVKFPIKTLPGVACNLRLLMALNLTQNYSSYLFICS